MLACDLMKGVTRPLLELCGNKAHRLKLSMFNDIDHNLDLLASHKSPVMVVTVQFKLLNQLLTEFLSFVTRMEFDVIAHASPCIALSPSWLIHPASTSDSTGTCLPESFLNDIGPVCSTVL